MQNLSRLHSPDPLALPPVEGDLLITLDAGGTRARVAMSHGSPDTPLHCRVPVGMDFEGIPYEVWYAWMGCEVDLPELQRRYRAWEERHARHQLWWRVALAALALLQGWLTVGALQTGDWTLWLAGFSWIAVVSAAVPRATPREAMPQAPPQQWTALHAVIMLALLAGVGMLWWIAARFGERAVWIALAVVLGTCLLWIAVQTRVVRRRRPVWRIW